jgi:serpin B
MRLALTPAADFSGMSDVPLFIGKVVHQAFIDVTETGTEATAATEEGMTTGRYAPPTVFHPDHPFLYLIRDRKTGAVLFLGRVAGLAAPALGDVEVSTCPPALIRLDCKSNR